MRVALRTGLTSGAAGQPLAMPTPVTDAGRPSDPHTARRHGAYSVGRLGVGSCDVWGVLDTDDGGLGEAWEGRWPGEVALPG